MHNNNLKIIKVFFFSLIIIITYITVLILRIYIIIKYIIFIN